MTSNDMPVFIHKFSVDIHEPENKDLTFQRKMKLHFHFFINHSTNYRAYLFSPFKNKSNQPSKKKVAHKDENAK